MQKFETIKEFEELLEVEKYKKRIIEQNNNPKSYIEFKHLYYSKFTTIMSKDAVNEIIEFNYNTFNWQPEKLRSISPTLISTSIEFIHNVIHLELNKDYFFWSLCFNLTELVINIRNNFNNYKRIGDSDHAFYNDMCRVYSLISLLTELPEFKLIQIHDYVRIKEKEIKYESGLQSLNNDVILKRIKEYSKYFDIMYNTYNEKANNAKDLFLVFGFFLLLTLFVMFFFSFLDVEVFSFEIKNINRIIAKITIYIGLLSGFILSNRYAQVYETIALQFKNKNLALENYMVLSQTFISEASKDRILVELARVVFDESNLKVDTGKQYDVLETKTIIDILKTFKPT